MRFSSWSVSVFPGTVPRKRKIFHGGGAGVKGAVLGKAGRERFLAIMEGQTIECEDYRKKKRMLTVKRENPVFTAVVKKEGRDGIKVTVDKDINGLFR